ncbi:hypothetical protein BF49_2434 [Bradyrhizobium sp.]|nr:hypothetical protein BF49_2434 [Bradyrhizobium sp.]
MVWKEPISDADLLRLMSDIISLRERVAQAELRAHHLKQTSLHPSDNSSTTRQVQKR